MIHQQTTHQPETNLKATQIINSSSSSSISTPNSVSNMADQGKKQHRRSLSHNLLDRRIVSPVVPAYSPKSLRVPVNKMQHQQQRSPMRHVEVNNDSCTAISSLPDGSITPNKEYDPAKDPIYQTFVPPLEITVKVMVPIPDWLRAGCDDDNGDMTKQQPLHNTKKGLSHHLALPSVDHSDHYIPRQKKPSPLSSRQKSNQTTTTEATSSAFYLVTDSKAVPLKSPPKAPFRGLMGRRGRELSTTPSISQHSLQTSPTDDSSNASTASDIPKRRRGLVRTEIKHFMSKMTPMFHSRRNSTIDVPRPRGCLA